MHIEAQPALVDRLREQTEFLQRTYQAELAKDPTSRAAESSRSNLIALRHSIHQIYGSVLLETADEIGSEPLPTESEE